MYIHNILLTLEKMNFEVKNNLRLSTQHPFIFQLQHKI